MKRRRDFPRLFKGYVAQERQDGPIIWGTLRPDAAECRKQFERWNPGVAPVIRAVRLSVDAQAGGRVSPVGSGPATD